MNQPNAATADPVVREGEFTEAIFPPGKAAPAVYVYEAPVRLWHWVTALCIFALAITGFLIGSPPTSIGGEASDHFQFGWIRLIHFSAGQILGVAFILRVFWAFVGNSHSRQLFVLPVFRGHWYKAILEEIKWYLMIARKPVEYVGHNPLAHISMFLLFVLPVIFMMLTGFALYAEGAGIDSAWYAVFGWVFGWLGSSMAVHTLHHFVMYVLLMFTTVHLYIGLREDIVRRQSTLSTMVNGWRLFKNRGHWGT
ncbi:MAG: Ni/Fe-hydrogenase, b-type cytochrome subunit [Steroidobacteraceae bacterium]